MTLFSESLETFQEAWTGDEGNYRIAEMSAGIIRFGVAPPGIRLRKFRTLYRTFRRDERRLTATGESPRTLGHRGQYPT